MLGKVGQRQELYKGLGPKMQENFFLLSFIEGIYTGSLPLGCIYKLKEYAPSWTENLAVLD